TVGKNNDGVCKRLKPDLSAEMCEDLEDELFYRRMEYKSKLFTLAYIFMIIILCSSTVCLFVWLQSKQVNLENAVDNNALKFNVSEIRFTEQSGTTTINNSSNGHHLRKNYLITITYRVDKGDDTLRCISIISLFLLMVSVISLPVVLFYFMEAKNY
ncbi:hypothetical protein AVEN_262742-1, partial [Araneus ventricosus]